MTRSIRPAEILKTQTGIFGWMESALVLSIFSEYLQAQVIDIFPLAQPITRRENASRNAPIMIQTSMNSLSQMFRKQ